MSHLPFCAPLACTSSLLWSGVENRLLWSFGCLLILVLELLRNVPLQETLNAPDVNYKVCTHTLSPVKQTNKVSLLLFSRSPAPPASSLPPLATTICLCQLPYFVYLILHPISHMPRPYSPRRTYIPTSCHVDDSCGCTQYFRITVLVAGSHWLLALRP